MKTISLVAARKKMVAFLTSLCLGLVFPLSSLENQDKNHPAKKPQKITEEILVTSKAPRETLVSSVTIIETQLLEKKKPVDLAEAIKSSTGVYVTWGEKNEFNLRLRGMDSRRLALFLDGVPASEPFFSSFDLKTIDVASVQAIQITRGPASVLYGPNTLGGIVNVITGRPSAEPRLTLRASYGENRTRSLSLVAGQSWNRLAATATILLQDSAGFYYSDRSNRKRRENSDYERLSLNAKLFYALSSRAEMLVQASFYSSTFGLPPSLTSTKPRYWRFKKWDRLALSTGGYADLGRKVTLRWRAYGMAYDNVLDSYREARMENLEFRSTYDNAVYGLFSLAELPVRANQTIRASCTLQEERARVQEDKHADWQNFRQRIMSAALEDHYRISASWLAIAGASFDHLNKPQGSTSSKFNPLVGLKFSPEEAWEVHVSFSRKSRFPSMRSLYAPSFGNPDLTSESGNLWEIGFSRSVPFVFSGAIFFSHFRDMIESVRLPDGRRRFYNISQASIDGLEIQVSQSSDAIQMDLSYTYLHHKNKTENRPLDALPEHSFAFDFSFSPTSWLRATFSGLRASSATWFDPGTGALLPIPSYLDLSGVLSFFVAQFEVFLKGSNLLNRGYFTEPGFPCRARTFEVGFKIDLFHEQSSTEGPLPKLRVPGRLQFPASL